MTVSFKNSPEDFLEYHLYGASQSKDIMRRRNVALYAFTVIYVLLGIFMLANGSIAGGAAFVMLGIAWYFVFPKLTANSSRKFYSKHIAANYGARMESTTTLTITDEQLIASDENSEVRTKISEIEKLVEAKRCYFLKLKSGSAFIIPKDQIAGNDFKLAAESRGIPVESQPDWQWK